MLVACAVSESYKTGMELTKDNRWEDAIGYFEVAIKEDPGNQDYLQALKKAKQEAAKRRYERARQQLSSAPDTVPDLEKIAKESAAALKLDPENQDIKAFHDKLIGRIGKLREMASTFYAQADKDMQKEDWLSALIKLKQVNKIYPGYEETGAKLAKIAQDGAKMLYQQGIALGKQEEWKMAAEAFKNAMEINPNYFDVAKQYEMAKSRDNVDYFLASANAAVKNENWERAIYMYERALGYQPENQNIVKAMADLKQKTGLLYFEDAKQLTKQGRYYDAFKKIEKAKNYVPALLSDPAYKEFAKLFTAKLVEKGDKYFERELWGNALIWYQYAEALNPTHPELFQKLLDVKDNINKRIKKSVAVFDFGSPANNRDAGKIAANKLVSYLHKNASVDIKIMERENLQSILREMQLGQTGIVDMKAAQSLGKVRGIDTFIMGEVLTYAAKTTDNVSTSQLKVLVDEEEIPNPEFSFWQMTNRRPTDEDLKNAPPRTIKKRNYQFIPYRHGMAKITASIEISYKLVDTATGENIFSTTVSGRLVKEDQYQDAVPAANIPNDPLELPTELEVLDELTNQKYRKWGKVSSSNSKLGSGVLQSSGSAEVKTENHELAIEKYVDAIFDEKLKSISTPISAKSWEILIC